MKTVANSPQPAGLSSIRSGEAQVGPAGEPTGVTDLVGVLLDGRRSRGSRTGQVPPSVTDARPVHL
jgi:hypothetical protein